MKHIKRILSRPFRSRRATGLSLLSFAALVVITFHLVGEDTEAEGPQIAPLSNANIRRSAPSVDSNSDLLQVGRQVNDDQAGSDVILAAAENDEPIDVEEWQRQVVLGTWEDDYRGKRTLTVERDGTGRMMIELDGVGKRLFGERLSFDMSWTLDNGYVTMKTLGGEPASKVKLVMKMYGSEARYKILEATRDRLWLLDGDGKTKYDWRRPDSSVPAESSSSDTH